MPNGLPQLPSFLPIPPKPEEPPHHPVSAAGRISDEMEPDSPPHTPSVVDEPVFKPEKKLKEHKKDKKDKIKKKNKKDKLKSKEAKKKLKEEKKDKLKKEKKEKRKEKEVKKRFCSKNCLTVTSSSSSSCWTVKVRCRKSSSNSVPLRHARKRRTPLKNCTFSIT